MRKGLAVSKGKLKNPPRGQPSPILPLSTPGHYKPGALIVYQFISAGQPCVQNSLKGPFLGGLGRQTLLSMPKGIVRRVLAGLRYPKRSQGGTYPLESGGNYIPSTHFFTRLCTDHLTPQTGTYVSETFRYLTPDAH